MRNEILYYVVSTSDATSLAIILHAYYVCNLLRERHVHLCFVVNDIYSIYRLIIDVNQINIVTVTIDDNTNE